LCKRNWATCTVLIGAILIASPILAPVSAYSASYFVATNGSDSNPGTQSQPFRTINRAVGALTPGTVLYIRAGTYTEGLTNAIPGGTSWDQPVTIAAYPGEVVIVKPAAGTMRVLYLDGAGRKYIIIDGLILDGSNVSYDAVKITYAGNDVTTSAHHVRIMNTEIRNAPAQGILVSGQSSSNEFINLKVHDNGTTDFDHGIYISTDSNLVERCEIFRNAGWGVHIYNGSGTTNGNVVRSNRIYNNARLGQRGAALGLYTGDNNVAYNNIMWGQQMGISLDYGANSAVVVNNTIYANREAGIYNGAGSNRSVIQNNIVYKNSVAVTDAGSGTALSYNLIDRDPQFKDPSVSDFHLQSMSPAIAAGTTLPLVKTDFDGVPRPIAKPYSVGAYEPGNVVLPGTVQNVKIK